MVSVIVPTFNSVRFLKECLRSARQQTYGSIEVVIVDRYSTDGTREIAESYGARIIQARAERSEARNIGAEKATGRLIFFMDSDMELDLSVVDKCVKEIGEGFDAVIVPEISAGEGFWAKCKALEKACYIGDDTIEAARFFKRSTFDFVNGYDPELLFGEDKDLDIRIRKAGFKVGRVKAALQHHEGMISLRETMLKKHHYGKTLSRYRKKHSGEAKQQLNLIRPAFIRNWRKLAKDPAHALGIFLMKSCEFGVVKLGNHVGER